MENTTFDTSFTLSKSYFFKRLFAMLLPSVLPILILGVLSISLSLYSSNTNVIMSSQTQLEQTQGNLELIISSLDSVRLGFGSGYQLHDIFKRVSSSGKVFYLDNIMLRVIQSFINAPANSHPYVHSLYIYYPNTEGYFLTDNDGMCIYNSYYDRSWRDSLERHMEFELFWSERRELLKYDFLGSSTGIISIYERLEHGGGIIVMNIYKDQLLNMAQNLLTYKNQGVFIFNEREELLVSCGNADLISIANGKESDRYFVFENQSTSYGWRCVSVVPKTSVYAPAINIIRITAALFLLMLVFCITFIVLVNHRTYRNIETIISILNATNAGQLPETGISPKSDEYIYITQSIVRSFIEQRYLAVQLSEKKYKLQVMELIAMQSQINPHFLFNTLDTINWKVIRSTKMPNEISSMICALSDIIQYSLSNASHLVCLRNEIENTKSYLQIMKLRYPDKFDMYWQYDPGVEDYAIIKLLFQPLLENSIYHGIKEKQEKGSIKIRIQLANSRLHISIIDNGLGIPAERLAELRQNLIDDISTSDAIGFANSCKRISLVFQNEYRIIIRSKYGLGTAVHIWIPAWHVSESSSREMGNLS